MKKLSLLVALALLVTVGGVYATWTYTSSSADIVDATKEIVVELADATTTGAAGTYTITSNLELTIDQITENDGSTEHKAELRYGSTDGNPIHLTVTFTPAKNADQSVKLSAIPTELYFTTTTTMKCATDQDGNLVNGGNHANGKPIFTFSNPSDGVFNAKPGDPNYKAETAVDWLGPNPDGSFTATYNETELKAMIELNTPIILDTKVDYDEFVGLLDGNIAVHLTDGTVQNSGSSSDQG